MMLGVALGFVVGILPGLGGPVALALVLPFVVDMTPVEAFAFLLGLVSVTATTGDITSVLLGVPGEPTSTATVVDGHPMARNGEAGRALGAALTGSLIGAVFGALILAAVIPVVRPLVLALGSPEFFALGILGMSLVGTLSGPTPLKGAAAGGAGVLLSTVGLDPQTGIERYTFGQLGLWEGLGLVPVTVGLFGLPEIIELWTRGGSISRTCAERVGAFRQGCRDVFAHWRLTLRCSAIGTLVGVVPGLGGATAQWLAYAHAVQSAGDRTRFGSGDVRGVIGPAAANNSKEGGSLIPTIAFGVPGSVSMAILLGAFVVQGLVPGPDMLTTHLSLTFSFAWIIVFANVVTVALCFLFLDQVVKITRVRGSLLVPGLLVLVYLGSFADSNSAFAMGITLLFGLVGLLMVQADWPRPPLVLGLVLGPVVERNLFISYERYGAAFAARPGVVAILLAALLLFLPTVRKGAFQRERPEAAAAVRPSIDLLLGSLLVMLSAWMLWEAWTWPARARFFPWWAALAVLCLGVVRSLAALRFTLSGTPPAVPIEPRGDQTRRLAICGWAGVFCLGVWLFGFRVASPALALAFLRIGAHETWKTSLLFGAGTYLVLTLVFGYALGLPFPPGAIAEAAGLASLDSYVTTPILRAVVGR